MNKPENNATPASSQERELSHDQELWKLLGQSSPQEADPLFSRNVMREIRLQEDGSAEKGSFWKSLLAPRFALPGALAALACAAVLLWNPTGGPDKGLNLADTADNEAFPVDVATSLESSLESELLLAAADTPELFSDEEVISMLF